MPLAIMALLLTVAANVYRIPADLERIRLVTDLRGAGNSTISEVRDSDDRIHGRAQLYAAAVALAVVAFLGWSYRAHKNLQSLGATDMSFSPLASVMAWFVPFILWWRPYQAMSELWRASAGIRGSGWKLLDNGRLIGPWWALWIIAGWVGSFALQQALNEPDSLEDLTDYSYLVLADDVLLIAAALLAAGLVRQISVRQDRALAATGAITGQEEARPRSEFVLAGGGLLAAAGLIGGIFLADLPYVKNKQITESPSAAKSPSTTYFLTQAPRLLDVSKSVSPDLRPVDPAQIGLSRASMGLDTRYSEILAYQSLAPPQIVFMFLQPISSRAEVATVRASVRDEKLLEKGLIGGLARSSGVAQPPISWSELGVGEDSRVGRFALTQQGVELQYEFAFFVQSRGDEGALVYVANVYQTQVPPSTSIKTVAEAIAANIKR